MNTKKHFLSILMLLSFCLSLLANPSTPSPVSSLPAAPVIYWSEAAYQAFGGAQYQHSLMASRINAMMHLAVHDALNGIEQKYGRYAFRGVDTEADPIAAAAAAAHTVLVHEMPEKKAHLDAVLATALRTVSEGDSKAKGIALGTAAAEAVLYKRTKDGATGELFATVAPSSTPGVYQAVPPFPGVFARHWENVQLFSLQRKDQFRPAPYPALTSPAYAAAFAEVKEYGKAGSNVRTPDQTAYAKFWYEFSEAGWSRIACNVVKDKKLNMLEAARVLALVDMALADAYIAGWDAKLHYNFWRPYTAIRNAASDGNATTAPDTAWSSSEPTPPVQDYPSTHSALGNAAATVLARLLGDQTSFSLTSPTALPNQPTRSFTSFSQAANENADSRVRAGLHFRVSCEAGQDLGNKIGNWTVDNQLRPLK